MWNIAMALFQGNLDIYIIFKEHYNFMTSQKSALQPNIIVFFFHHLTLQRLEWSRIWLIFHLGCIVPYLSEKDYEKLYLISEKFLAGLSPCCNNLWSDLHPGSHTWGLLNTEAKWGRHTSPTIRHKEKSSQEIPPACCPREAETWDIWSCSHKGSVLTNECPVRN